MVVSLVNKWVSVSVQKGDPLRGGEQGFLVLSE